MARVANHATVQPRLDQHRDLRDHGIKGFGMLAPLPSFEKHVLRRCIHQQHAAFAVDGDDTGAYGLQHCLDEAAPFLEFLVRTDQSVGLLFKLGSHAVERAVEQADFVSAGPPFDTQREVTRAYLASRRNEVGQRLYLAVGKSQSEPDGEPHQRKADEI